MIPISQHQQSNELGKELIGTDSVCDPKTAKSKNAESGSTLLGYGSNFTSTLAEITSLLEKRITYPKSKSFIVSPKNKSSNKSISTMNKVIEEKCAINTKLNPKNINYSHRLLVLRSMQLPLQNLSQFRETNRIYGDSITPRLGEIKAPLSPIRILEGMKFQSFKELIKYKKRKAKEEISLYKRQRLINEIKSIKTNSKKNILNIDEMLIKDAVKQGDTNIRKIQVISRIKKIRMRNFHIPLLYNVRNLARRCIFDIDKSKQNGQDEELKKALKNYLSGNKNNTEKIME